MIMGIYQGKTAQQWREMAQANRTSAQRSWENCDTDGFVSQWADVLTAREYDTCATLAESDGWAEFPALFDIDGNLMDASQRSGDFGPYWLIKGLPKGVKPFFTESNARKASVRYANDSRKGYRVGTVRRKGYVTLRGSGRGLAGAMSVGVAIVPDRDSNEVEIVDDGSLRTWYQQDWS